MLLANFEENGGTAIYDQVPGSLNNGTIVGSVNWTADIMPSSCIACSSTDSVYVSIIDVNIAQNDTTICFGDSITLSVGNTNLSSACTLPLNLQNGLMAYYPFCGTF